jgi:hypothetical protein
MIAPHLAPITAADCPNIRSGKLFAILATKEKKSRIEKSTQSSSGTTGRLWVMSYAIIITLIRSSPARIAQEPSPNPIHVRARHSDENLQRPAMISPNGSSMNSRTIFCFKGQQSVSHKIVLVAHTAYIGIYTARLRFVFVDACIHDRIVNFVHARNNFLIAVLFGVCVCTCAAAG